MKLTITRVFKKDRVSKDGNPFVSLSIKTQEYGDKWLGGFQNAGNENWKAGDVVEADVEKNGEYLNYKLPKKEKQAVASNPETEKLLKAILHNTEEIIKKLNDPEALVISSEEMGPDADVPELENVPF